MRSACVEIRSIFLVFLLIAGISGTFGKIYAQEELPPEDEPLPVETDPWILPVDEMPTEEVGEEEIFAVSPPFWGDTLDSTAAAAADPCPACNPNAAPLAASTPLNCPTHTQSVSPIKRCNSSSKFLCAGTSATPLRLVGASADVGCHLNFNHPDKQRDFCNYSNYKKVLDNLACYKLNKMRLWVAINGNPEGAPYTSDPVASFPFEYNAGGGYWRLDRKNKDYFDRLVEVVSRAKDRNIYVEVTFFAPWEGVSGTGPFAGANGRWCLDGPDAKCTAANLKNAGFANPYEFVVMSEGRTATGFDTQIKRAREAQRNIIRWTVERLWCYDNVIFEIANEPEGGGGANATAAEVTKWEAEMIEALRAAETPGTAPMASLQARHLVSVQPFTTQGASYALGQTSLSGASEMAYVDLVNGHYTTVSRTGPPAINMGALQLARDFTRSKPVGFNETKISSDTTTKTWNGSTDPCGAATSARSEAWEFLLNLSAVYDHWGYNYSSTNGQAVRRQMCYLKDFMGKLPITQLKAQTARNTTAPFTGIPPSWVNVQDYPSTPDTLAAGVYTYWAAAEPASNATSPNYVLYLHRDQRSCVATPSCPCESTSVIPLRGYHPVLTAAPTTTLTLKNLNPGSYTLSWIKPETAGTIGNTATVVFNANQSCTINGGATTSPCKVTAPAYTYDVALWLKKNDTSGSGTAEM